MIVMRFRQEGIILVDGFSAVNDSSCGKARSLLEKRRFKVVFCSDSLPDGEYAEVIRAARPTPVIVLSRSADWDSYLAALQAGAFDYIACPPDQAEVDRILSSALNEHLQPLRQRSSAA
jgi:DNA-binding NtrC family response regulator